MDKADIALLRAQCRDILTIHQNLPGRASVKPCNQLDQRGLTSACFTKQDIEIIGNIRVTELSGSQSSAHFSFADENWVSLAHGVHPFDIGENHAFYINIAKCFFFSVDGQLVAQGVNNG